MSCVSLDNPTSSSTSRRSTCTCFSSWESDMCGFTDKKFTKIRGSVRNVGLILRLGLFFILFHATGLHPGLTAMPVRKVPKNYRNLTGLVPNTRTSSMTAFESSLERDFLLLLDFDPDVTFYEEQPVTIA